MVNALYITVTFPNYFLNLLSRTLLYYSLFYLPLISLLHSWDPNWTLVQILDNDEIRDNSYNNAQVQSLVPHSGITNVLWWFPGVQRKYHQQSDKKRIMFCIKSLPMESINYLMVFYVITFTLLKCNNHSLYIYIFHS